jgi:hypothetical protein
MNLQPLANYLPGPWKCRCSLALESARSKSEYAVASHVATAVKVRIEQNCFQNPESFIRIGIYLEVWR